MPDKSYQPLVYRKQGGDELVVGSSGVITIESGGHITMPVTSMTTTSGTITNSGITTFGTTIASAYTLAAPTRAGLEKILACTVHGATTVSQVITTNSTGTTIAGSSVGTTATLRTLTFTNAGQAVRLVSLSTSAWVITANVNTVALTS